ncbi:Bromodomain-containing protein, partial [Ascoidea rubescens DSM 1968]
HKKFISVSNTLLSNISSMKFASTFLQPVNENDALNYYSLVYEPRDLKTIKQMIKDGRITNSRELEREILLMFSNAIMYNKSNSDVYQWAKEMQRETDVLISLFKEAE